ncbi:hypothetical protein NUU61_007279 [Penicillium alfredii]|uniref:GAR domain-containing protein n=1 Tax=Penicillium alfredii TaxID=1506179 RepID=A0A9W9F2J9_9EURO|nr:uncharacterized protein NUU61_007279 [Penicillium alfredii]KAJ5092409.1 hypothetical protein NUU61_007279 [Penicillium alfredii]
MAASRTSPLRPSIRLSPAHSRNNSCSTSPERLPTSIYQKVDPLLSNLSPESTLNALTSTEAIPSNEKLAHDVLSQSISQVSPAERALGIRAAIAAQNLNIWYREVQSWRWPNQNEAKIGKGFIPPTDSGAGEKPSTSSILLPPGTREVDHYGCLPAVVVEGYEKRVEEIRDGMDNLDVEELKEHVLNAHIPSRSRPSSSTSSVSVPPPLSYVQLSDFTAVITATILRALPFLTRLNRLLTTWDVRLLVLRQIPGLLRELGLTRSALDTSLHALRASNPSGIDQTPYSSAYLRAEHVKLESAVVSVGRRVDRILDALEGRPDSLPERWIDELEGIESDFAAWVVEAERYTVHNECLRVNDEPPVPETPEDPNPTPEEKPEDMEQETRQDAAEAQSTRQETARQMDTIKEGPRNGSETPTQESNQESSERPTQDFMLPSPKDHAPSPPVPVPEISVNPESPSQEMFHSTADVEKKTEELSTVVVAGELETPTQANFPPEQPVQTVEQSSSASASRPATPDMENKENIPPPGFNQQITPTSPRVSQVKPAALSEHTDLVEDPFVQFPRVRNEAGTNNVPELTAATDESPRGKIDMLPVAEKQTTLPTVDSGKEDEAQAVGDLLQPDHSLPETQPTTDRQSNNPATDVGSQPQGQPGAPTEPGPNPILADTPNRIPNTHDLDTKQSVHLPSRSIAAVESSDPGSKSSSPKSHSSNEPKAADNSGPRKPLQSPIKLSKKPRGHRPSTGSMDSLLSDGSSLSSSADAPEPNTASSNENPLMVPSHKERHTRSDPSHDHTLREDRLLRLEHSKGSSPKSLQQTRSVSLPLERFINERLDLNLDGESVPAVRGPKPTKPSAGSADLPSGVQNQDSLFSKDVSLTPTPQMPRPSRRRPALSRGKSSFDLRASRQASMIQEQNRKSFAKNAAHRPIELQDQPKSFRLRQRLTAHPSLESLGVKRQELPYVEEDESELTDFESRSSSPNKRSRKPRDQLDEKISSILNTLPGRIHLVDPNNEAETSSSSSSLDRRLRDRYRSESPQGLPSRSATPAPSFMLMPAARRRSHAHKMEDSCIKLYHLHHGGQSTPSKLFVRTVGEEGRRVMVRVGGGWADLGEYLREYVIHHGRRKVSETPRVEVQGLASRASPSYSSPGTNIPQAAPSYALSGRATPSRPPSVLSARPSSSLTVRKMRRGSNASDAVVPRSVTTGNINSFTSPPAVIAPTRRRLSASSSYSFSDTHSPANPVAGPSNQESRSTPLGLAGPKPRSRHVSMSPEGEAWVKDVLQQTRRSSSLNPPPFPLSQESDDAEAADSADTGLAVPSLPKVRSVGDIGLTGTSRRVVLRGLGSRRS